MFFVKNKFNKKLLFVLIVLGIEFSIFKFCEMLFENTQYVLRGWIINMNLAVLYFIIFLLMVGMIRVVFNFSKKYSKQIRIIVRFIVCSIIIVCFVYYSSIYLLISLLSYQYEKEIIKDDQIMVVRELSYGFHHTEVEFFYPVNYFLLEKSEYSSVIVDGNFDYCDLEEK